MNNTVKMKDIVFSDEIFKPMLTNTPLDEMFSFEGGIFPATNYMLIGDPGSGKTTIGLDVIANIKAFDSNRKVLFISAEMNQIDMFGFAKRYPKFNDLDILFTGELSDKDLKKELEHELNQGYDLILADSFVEIQESVMESCKISRNQAEKWLIDLMNKHNLGNNKGKIHSSFIMVQQVTKGGVFAGSNKLKHNTTGMCELRKSKDMHDERYISFTKNRRGCKHEKLYYDLSLPDHVDFDEQRLKRDSNVRKLIKKEDYTFDTDQEEFEQLLESLPTEKSMPKRKNKEPIMNGYAPSEDLPF